MFMRASGIVLTIMLTVHLTSNLIVPSEGVRTLDFAFVAGKWSSFGWQLCDLTILWLAMIHGANGLRTIINDYAHNNVVRLWCKVLLAIAFAAVVLLGTLVIFTFDPCPAIDGVVRPGSPAFCFAP